MAHSCPIEADVDGLQVLAVQGLRDEVTLLREAPGYVLGSSPLAECRAMRHDPQICQVSLVLGADKTSASRHELVHQIHLQGFVAAPPGCTHVGVVLGSNLRLRALLEQAMGHAFLGALAERQASPKLLVPTQA